MTVTRKSVRPRAAAAAPLAPLDFFTDLGRQQLSVATEASCAMFRGFERMRNIQQKAAHDASARHQALAGRLQEMREPGDLLAAQAALLKGDLEEAGQYWQQLAAAALEMQVEMMGCATHLVDSEAALETASVMEALDALPGMSALFGRKGNGAARAAV